jgi:hypothetical protein
MANKTFSRLHNTLKLQGQSHMHSTNELLLVDNLVKNIKI